MSEGPGHEGNSGRRLGTGLERLRVLKAHLAPTPHLHHHHPASSTSGRRREDGLCAEERELYERNGYLVFPKLVGDEALDTYAARFRDLCEGRVRRGEMTLMKDLSLVKSGAVGEHLYNKVQDFMWDEVLFQYCATPQVVELVQSLTGPNVMAMHTMLINKPPDGDTHTSTHPLHQDLHYFPFRPASRIICSWTAMEKITRENGCLVVLPGTHKGTLLPHDYPRWEGGVQKLYHGVKGYENHPVVHLEMEKGDTVLFHPLLIHGSGPNRTKGFRKAISCHYAASECEYIEVKGTSQENIAVEAETIALKRGFPTDYVSIWKYRGRLVAGERLSL